MGLINPLVAQDQTRNFVLTRTYKVPLKDAAVPVSVGEATLSLGYFDGLGRLQQTVSVQAGKDKQDVVAPIEYDALGRLSKTYLPVNTATQTGAFQPTAAALATTYYNNATRFADATNRVYTEPLYEASPLNRPIGQISAGTARSTTIAYGINDVSVRKYQAGTGLTDITRNGNYEANQLTITQTIDEEGKQISEYTDKDGRVILRRAGSGQTLTNTYYVYDDLNKLRAVIQPAYELITNPQPSDITNYAFLYLYDSWGRLMRKKVPGAGVTRLDYNTRDLLTKTTDSVGNVVNIYYDELNRPIQTTRGDGQPLSYTYYDDYESFMPDGSRLFDGLGFLTSTDTYSWTTTDDFVPVTMRTTPRKGQVTGQCMRLLNADGTLSSTYNCQVNYYDNRYRLIQTVRRIPLGSNGIERISYKRDFAGKVLSEKTTHSWSSQSYTLEKLLSYDHAERLTSTRYITSGSDANLAGKDKYINALAYNEIGQLADKYLNATDKNGTGAVEHLTYKNNVRGWLREHTGVQLSSRPYSLTLGYQNNGNIQSQSWRHPSMSQAKTYQFSYDELNRLLSGDQGAGGLSEITTYDLNGNIKTLNRRDATGALIDVLSYTYWPDNRLRSISDGATITGGFIDYPGAEDYSQDLNGNMLTDNNKGIYTNIIYNYLNLPQKITLNGKTLNYVYDAGGTKHSLSINGVTTSYEGIFEYDGAGLPTRIQTDEGQLVKDGTVWKWQYYLKDHLGNVRVVLDETGGPGSIQETEYYPFGLAIPKTPSDITASRAKNKYLYLNRELQEQTGWLDLKARFYDPTIGLFLSIDPQTESQEYLSPYHYSYDNPIRFSDPDGLMGDDCCGGVVSFVSGFGSALRDDFGSPDGRSLHRDQVSDAGKYNSGRELGHNFSLLASATEIAAGLLGDGAALTGEIASFGLATPAAAALGATSTAAIVHGFNSANNAINNLQKDNGRLEARSNGRSGKTERLKELAKDPKESSANRGWIKQEQNSIARGSKRMGSDGVLRPQKNIRSPPGKDLAHARGRRAKDGHSYKDAKLQDKDLHKLEHKHEGYK